jgi:hypothetical protein
MRACALAPKVLAAAALAGAPPCQFLILETEELFGGKIKAMVDRHHPRDLYTQRLSNFRIDASWMAESEVSALLYHPTKSSSLF